MAVRPNKTKQGQEIPRSWVIDIYPEGRKGKRLIRVVNDCSESEARTIEMQLRRRKTGIKNAVNPVINDVVPNWFEWLRLHRAANTLDSVTWAWKKLKPHFGHRTVGEITELAITKYQQQHKATACACNLEINYLKSLIG